MVNGRVPISTLYKKGVLGFLGGALAFITLERIVLGVALQDIKLDLRLTDTQLGFLTGIAFAFFYAVMGIPIARWADRGDRVTILSITLWLFAVTSILSGLVVSFTQLLLVRMFVAVGEAGVQPVAGSLIGSIFDRAERPRATATFAVGAPLASVTGFFAVGWLNDAYGWRETLMITALPCLILAICGRIWFRDPRRSAPREDTLPQSTLGEVVEGLAANSTFQRLSLCFALILFFTYGCFQWLPSFLTRSYGLSSTEIGLGLALTWGGSGVFGAYLSGRWASKWAAGNEELQLRAQACALVLGGIFSLFTYLAPTAFLSFLFLGLAAFALATTNGPLNGSLVTLVPDRMRATAIAILFLVSNLIGLGLGPLAVGILSDAFHVWAGEESLRWALAILSPGYGLAALLSWSASRSVTADVAASESD